MITDAEIPATFVRPWYVLGPGRSWPVVLKPFYALALLYPSTRESVLRLPLFSNRRRSSWAESSWRIRSLRRNLSGGNQAFRASPHGW